MKESVLWPILQRARNHATSQSDMLGTNFDVDKFEQKFAELIVKECAKKGFDIFDEEPDAPASDLQFYVRDRILQHFGVEE